MAPLVALARLATWGVTFGITRISAAASLVAAAVYRVIAVALFALGTLPLAYALFAGAAAAIVILHRANIRRLRAGTEHRFEKLF